MAYSVETLWRIRSCALGVQHQLREKYPDVVNKVTDIQGYQGIVFEVWGANSRLAYSKIDDQELESGNTIETLVASLTEKLAEQIETTRCTKSE